MTIIGTGCFSDCFTIRDLRLLELNLQFFVIFQTPLQGTEMKLTLSMHNSLFQFLRLLHFPSRIFLTHTVQYNHHLLYISLIYRLDGTRVFSIRIFNEVKPVFTVFAVQGISSLYIFQFHSTTNISGYQFLHRNTISSRTNKKLCHTLFRASISISQIVTFVYFSAHHFKILHTTDMGFNGSLEEIKRSRAIRIGRHRNTTGIMNHRHIRHEWNNIT